MANEQKTAKIRAALQQLDTANDAHWTDDGLPREGVVRELAKDTSLSRKDIQTAWPGFQRTPGGPAAETDDPLAGETVETANKETGASPVSAEARAAYRLMSADDPGANPTQNTGEPMTEDEVRDVLEARVRDAEQGIADAQANVRAANKAVETAKAALRDAQDDLRREFPPLSQNQNIKQFIASEQQRRAERVQGGRAPARIDAVMARSNTRGWRRPVRQGPAQTTGVNRSAQA